MVEDPCYRSAVDILRAVEARIVPVPVDDDGLDIAAGAGSTLSAAPRLYDTVAAIPARHGDAARLAGPRCSPGPRRSALGSSRTITKASSNRPARLLPSLQGLDRGGRVIYLGTFSKLLFPSLRLGYAVLPEDLVAPFAGARHLADRQSSGLIQAIMTEFMLGGYFARHLKRMRALYAERQAVPDRALLQRRLGGLLRYAAGRERRMYLTAWLPSAWSDQAVAGRWRPPASPPCRFRH